MESGLTTHQLSEELDQKRGSRHMAHIFVLCRIVGCRTREPWLASWQDSSEAMPSKRSEQRQAVKVSWFTEREVYSEVVIGTAQ